MQQQVRYHGDLCAGRVTLQCDFLLLPQHRKRARHVSQWVAGRSFGRLVPPSRGWLKSCNTDVSGREIFKINSSFPAKMFPFRSNTARKGKVGRRFS